MVKPPKPAQDGGVWQTLGNFLGLAVLLPVSTFVGYAIGYWLDGRFGTTWLRIVFLLFGIAAGLIELIRQVNKDAKKSGG